MTGANVSIAIGVVVCLLILFTFMASSNEKRELRDRSEIDKRCTQIAAEETIFVSIVADSPRVAYVLFNLFNTSFCPFRVYVGICQVVTPGSQYLDVLEEYGTYANHKHDFSDNIRVYSVAAPCSQPRALIEQYLYRGEKYYLHVDANVIFSEFWDQTCITELHKCSAEYPMLTMAPLVVDVGKVPKPSYLRLSTVSATLNEPELETALFIHRPQSPIPSPFLSSQFLFTYATSFGAIADASDYVLSASFWTRGYDFFHPTRMIVTKMHTSGNAAPPTKMLPQLGSVRSLAAYEAWCGVRAWPQFLAAPTAYAGMNTVQSESEQILQKYGSRKLYQQRLFR